MLSPLFNITITSIVLIIGDALIKRMVRLGLSIADTGAEDDDGDMPPLDEAAEELETNKMEEVD